MTGISIGLDIGGTKIAGAAFDAAEGGGNEVAQHIMPTPPTYDALLETCRALVERIEQESGAADSIGACAPYIDDEVCANIPYLAGKNLRRDLEKALGRPVPIGNDANCAALAEAREGAGKGYRSVAGLILGTGVACGFVLNGHVISGPNNLSGEIGHLPLPWYEEGDGERVPCGCGQKGCIDKLASGAALARLYQLMTCNIADARKIAAEARAGDKDALRVLDRFYTVVAKAMVGVLHSFDPEIITVSGGLNDLPGLYEAVPKRWGRYAVSKNPVTKFVPAKFGARAGLRGAAWLGKDS